MTFFFDGVEPPESLIVPQNFADPNLSITPPEAQGPTWYVHEPRKNCTTCHGRRNQRRLTAKAFLLTPVPQLCYNCHDERTIKGPYVHGPVAVGECLFCHNPHKSQMKYLLKGSIPELCFLCHDEVEIDSIPDHSVSELSSCMDCHYAHSGLERALLKPDARRLSKERALPRPVHRSLILPEQTVPVTGLDNNDPKLLSRKREIAEVYYASMDLYREGKLAEARFGLNIVMNSGLIPQAMANTIRGYISDIDKRLAERKKQQDSR